MTLHPEVTRLKTVFQTWLGRTIAIALALSSSQSAIACPLVPPTLTNIDSPTSETVLTMLDPLELTIWQLVSYQTAEGATVEAFSDAPATLQFQAGEVFGTTGCNRFSGRYTREGDRLTIAEGATTLMGCFPEALALQETAILNNLSQVASYLQTGNQLQLLNREGTALLTLSPQPTAELTHTEWTLTAYNNGRGGLVTPLIDTTLTATFDPETGLAGSAGCNRYHATFEAVGDRLTMGPAASTRRLCAAPDGIMAQESAFLALLEQVATYTVSGNQLDLYDAEGTLLARFTTNL
jgi:heat shock protein HslJ